MFRFCQSSQECLCWCLRAGGRGGGGEPCGFLKVMPWALFINTDTFSAAVWEACHHRCSTWANQSTAVWGHMHQEGGEDSQALCEQKLAYRRQNETAPALLLGDVLICLKKNNNHTSLLCSSRDHPFTSPRWFFKHSFFVLLPLKHLVICGADQREHLKNCSAFSSKTSNLKWLEKIAETILWCAVEHILCLFAQHCCDNSFW